MVRLLKKGDRVRLKTKTVFGFREVGTVCRDQLDYYDEIIAFWKDGEEGGDDRSPRLAMRHQLALMRQWQ